MSRLYNEGKNIDGAMRLMEVLSGVDEELLERCRRDVRTEKGSGRRKRDRTVSHDVSGAVSHSAGANDRNEIAALGRKRRKFPGRYGGTWAAVLCLAVVGAVSWGGYMLTDIVNGGAAGGRGYNSGAVPEAIELAPEEGAEQQTGDMVQDMCASMAEDGEGMEVPGGQESDGAGAPNPDKEEAGHYGVNGDSGAGDKAAGEEAVPEKERSQDEACQEELSAESTNDLTSCKSLEGTKLTEEAARSMEGLGEFIPGKLPQGYAFESACCYSGNPETSLGITWTRGMDSIMLYLSAPETVPASVDISKPETYDERLYEIPHAETVPQEYRESMNDPVFAWEDMSLEVVRSRVVAREDAGDTDTPRGNFSVLYSNGVVLRFNGRGTAEEIWELLCSCVDSD